MLSDVKIRPDGMEWQRRGFQVKDWLPFQERAEGIAAW